MLEPEMFTALSYKRGDGLISFVSGGKAFNKIHLDTKKAGQLNCFILQRIILLTRGDQDDLNPYRQCFRRQITDPTMRRRTPQLLDLNAAVAQESIQLIQYLAAVVLVGQDVA